MKVTKRNSTLLLKARLILRRMLTKNFTLFKLISFRKRIVILGQI